MEYTEPKDVTSPQTSVSNVRPILDGGEWEYSLALLNWDDEPALGIRWNGGMQVSRQGKKKQHPGNPQSRGLPIWFILPPNLILPVLKALKNELGGESIDKKLAEKQVLEEIKRLEG
jgi:hypothetical protein